jgi:CRISPR-associated exonuclease Cas4
MNTAFYFVLCALALVAFGLVLMRVAGRARTRRGLGTGETVALDVVTLYSARHKLVGRPDRIVKCGDAYIPEEWKSSKRVSHGHRLQLGAYFILIEEHYGVRPPFGVVVLGDGSRVEVPNTDVLRREVLTIAEHIREHRANLTKPIPVSQPVQKCRRCGQRANCDQARA